MSGPKLRYGNTDIDYDKLESFLESGYRTMDDCCEEFKCSESTIVRRIREQYDMTFEGLRNKKLKRMRSELFDAMKENALKGNATIQIWLSKQILGMSDSPLPPASEMEPYPEPEDKPDTEPSRTAQDMA